MSGVGHYRLSPTGEIEMVPPATDGASHPYLVEIDGRPVLCVIEGGAFHRFKIDATAVGRLISEGGELFWRRERDAVNSAAPLRWPIASERPRQ